MLVTACQDPEPHGDGSLSMPAGIIWVTLTDMRGSILILWVGVLGSKKWTKQTEGAVPSLCFLSVDAMRLE